MSNKTSFQFLVFSLQLNTKIQIKNRSIISSLVLSSMYFSSLAITNWVSSSAQLPRLTIYKILYSLLYFDI